MTFQISKIVLSVITKIPKAIASLQPNLFCAANKQRLVLKIWLHLFVKMELLCSLKRCCISYIVIDPYGKHNTRVTLCIFLKSTDRENGNEPS